VPLALDGGGPDGPLRDGWTLLSPAHAWDPERGFGWVGAAPEFRDRGGDDPLLRDFVGAPAARTLRIHVPQGRHEVALLRGDASFASGSTLVHVDGEPVLGPQPQLPAGAYAWEPFALGGGADVDLRLSVQGASFWKVVALVVAPES
jgi:hypothetical protein